MKSAFGPEAPIRGRVCYGPDAGTNQFGNYLPFGDLFVDFKKGDQPASLSVEDFTRALDLRDGIHKVNYKADGVTYDREAFSSTPANVLVLNYKASKPGQFSADFSVNSQLGADISAKGPRHHLEGDVEKRHEL